MPFVETMTPSERTMAALNRQLLDRALDTTSRSTWNKSGDKQEKGLSQAKLSATTMQLRAK